MKETPEEAYKKQTATAIDLSKTYEKQKSYHKAKYYEAKEGQAYWENQAKILGSKYSEIAK